MLQNAQMALDFLRYKKIKLVNIRAEDIVDGNPKLTLGLIWTIILHFQVSPLEYNFKHSPPPLQKQSIAASSQTKWKLLWITTFVHPMSAVW